MSSGRRTCRAVSQGRVLPLSAGERPAVPDTC